jgi:hypothetical protein
MLPMRCRATRHHDQSVIGGRQLPDRRHSLRIDRAGTQEVRGLQLREESPHPSRGDLGVAAEDLPGRVLKPDLVTEIASECVPVAGERLVNTSSTSMPIRRVSRTPSLPSSMVIADGSLAHLTYPSKDSRSRLHAGTVVGPRRRVGLRLWADPPRADCSPCVPPFSGWSVAACREGKYRSNLQYATRDHRIGPRRWS